MPTVFTKGDIFHTDGLHAYAHGCNAAGHMDAGIAAQFKKRWPRMVEDYAARCQDGRFGLGEVFPWTEGDETIYNLCIQKHWKEKARLPALSASLKKMVEMAQRVGIDRIGLPRIGTGLGGFDWPRAKRILSEVGEETTVTLLVFEQFIRARETPGATPE